MLPKLAMCNIYDDIYQLKDFALEHGFDGIDWSFEMDTLPSTPSEESRWIKEMGILDSFEVRYHCPFHKIDIGHNDPDKAKYAVSIFNKIIRLISRTGGGYLSIHVGLGRDSTIPLSWDTTIENLKKLVQYGLERRVKVCLENLAWGWTSKPNLFEKLIRRSGAWVTIDIGHAAVCEAVVSQHYSVEDFITPHASNLVAAHLYDEEVSGIGHLPPENLSDIEDRLDMVIKTGCAWWVIEIREIEGLLKTKKMIDEYLNNLERNKLKAQG
ncbi:MAG: TIM barrel protein [Desulfobacteraceae bacterium]|jgi:sugar phosphate isomerase/epimerase